MESTENMENVVPVRVGIDHEFQFKCHKGVSCFTKCCRHINIVLTPYDIIRLKNRLGLSSNEFLAIYTEPQILEKTDLPMVLLKLLDDDEKSCPFVRDDGCIVYEDRPTTCRYYPLGIATLNFENKDDEDGFYFFMQEPHCKGFAEPNEMTVKEWRVDQGVDIHDDINQGWTELIVRKRSFPKNVKMTDESKKMFFMANYNIDQFKSFIFESSFLDRHEIDEKTIEEIKNDEIALLRFSYKWQNWIFYKIGEFKLRN